MLYSFVNTMLRDKFSSLEELCSAYDADPDEITEKLRACTMVDCTDLVKVIRQRQEELKRICEG